MVGSGELVGKPVALINASARSTWAQASITATLPVVMGRFIDGAPVTLALPSNKVDVDAIADHPEIAGALRAGIAAFARGIEGVGRASGRP